MELAIYRPRRPQNSPLYQMLESHYETIKGIWDDRFQRIYGYWRGFTDRVVERYLDCGVAENGFARLKCEDCQDEKLLTLSCKQRGLCPSCDAKRAAAFAVFLKDELLQNVGHAMWTFTLPKMLRIYFMNHRELLGDLCRIAYQTIHLLMRRAAGDDKTFRPGVVAVQQTFGSLVNVHPHIHCLATRGVWNQQGEWFPIPYVDTKAAEKIFRLKLLRLLKRKGLLNDERIRILNSFRHSGFSVHNATTIWPQDATGLERAARYLLRCPLSLSCIQWTKGAKTLFYQSKGSNDDPLLASPMGETMDVLEFLARVLTQIPQPRKHSVHYYGVYSTRQRLEREKSNVCLQSDDPQNRPCSRTDTNNLSPQQRAALRKRWASLIRRVFQSDPMICECGGKYKVISFITQPRIIRKILDHINNRDKHTRAPPEP